MLQHWGFSSYALSKKPGGFNWLGDAPAELYGVPQEWFPAVEAERWQKKQDHHGITSFGEDG